MRLFPISGQYIRHNEGMEVPATNSKVIGGISQRQLRSVVSSFVVPKLGGPARRPDLDDHEPWKAWYLSTVMVCLHMGGYLGTPTITVGCLHW